VAIDPKKTFVAVNLIEKQVVSIALLRDVIRDGEAYVLTGTILDDATTVVLDDDESWNGREAIRIATESGFVGLGWRFVTEATR
jgi:hypothetical protein